MLKGEKPTAGKPNEIESELMSHYARASRHARHGYAVQQDKATTHPTTKPAQPPGTPRDPSGLARLMSTHCFIFACRVCLSAVNLCAVSLTQEPIKTNQIQSICASYPQVKSKLNQSIFTAFLFFYIFSFLLGCM